ncbi:MAG: hypothetical protein M3R08_01320 [Bacteroidota bacterium]|nr:hypothetical protein [Bacteroidota bacterium]
MKWFNRIKEWMGRRRLLRELPRERRPITKNLADARKVAIVYVATDEKAFTHVKNYVKRVKEELGISNIMALGLTDEKVLPNYLHPRLNFEALTHKDLNWYRIPRGSTVENFMAEEFEVIIDLSLEDRLPVQYIVAKSRARFKVGRFSESNKQILDMMIDIAGAQSLSQLIQQVHNYLLMVNSKPKPSIN